MSELWQKLSNHRESVCSDDLRTCQARWLFDCIKRNTDTDYGRKHNFNKIKTIADYQKYVPIVEPQELSSLIDDIAKGKSDVLFCGKAIAFERTSGSVSGQKLIPYSNESLLDFRCAILPWLSSLIRQYKIDDGKAYWAISPAARQSDMTEAGIPVGLPDAAYLGEDLIPFFLQTSVVPHWVAEISDVNNWQLVTLYYLVCCDDLKLISVWSPTFLLSLMSALDDKRQGLEDVLQSGLDIEGHTLEQNQTAYAKLQNYYRANDVGVLWPELNVISCWADASSKYYSERLQACFPKVAIQAKGLLLTEGVITIPDQDNKTRLAMDSGFYEFMDEDKTIRLADELGVGDKYEIIMTTAGGLYRYRTFDRVICDAYVSGHPVLCFLGRALSSDMVGEKLSEEFVISCLHGIIGFRMLIPFIDKVSGYVLIVDDETNYNRASINSIGERVEFRLHDNPHYAYARKLGQLQKLKILPVNNALNVYLNSPVHTGTRLGDIKVPSLCLKTDIFNEYIGNAA